jgi:uncharacterized protein YutD
MVKHFGKRTTSYVEKCFCWFGCFFFFAIKRKQHMPKKQNKTKQKHHKNVFKVGLLKVGLEAWLKCRTLT